MPAKTQYSDDFKKEAIHWLKTRGLPVSPIEQDLGIRPGLLRKWQCRFRVNPQSDQLERSDQEQLKAELRAVKRELKITRMERDRLKKQWGFSRRKGGHEIRMYPAGAGRVSSCSFMQAV